MISYDPMSEEWEDDDDPDFNVDMTPEGSDDYDKTFTSQEDFWIWYYNS